VITRVCDPVTIRSAEQETYTPLLGAITNTVPFRLVLYDWLGTFQLQSANRISSVKRAKLNYLGVGVNVLIFTLDYVMVPRKLSRYKLREGEFMQGDQMILMYF